jgi:hypothetical protein
VFFLWCRPCLWPSCTLSCHRSMIGCVHEVDYFVLVGVGMCAFCIHLVMFGFAFSVVMWWAMPLFWERWLRLHMGMRLRCLVWCRS